MPQPLDLLEAIRDGITKATVARDREIARLAQRAKVLEVAAGSLRDALMALLPPTTVSATNGRPPARKRAPVKATDEQVKAVHDVLLVLPEPMTIKQLRKSGVVLGPKVVSAALHKLANDGLANMTSLGRWSAIRPEGDNA